MTRNPRSLTDPLALTSLGEEYVEGMKDESPVTNALENIHQVTPKDESQPASPQASVSAAEPEDALTFRGVSHKVLT